MRAGASAGPADDGARVPVWEMEADAQRGALPAVQAALELFLVGHGVAEPLRLRAAVLTEEAFMNAVMHAVAGAADPRVRLRALLPTGELVLQLEERGQPFEAPAAALRSAAADPAEGSLGGRGLLLMQRLAERVERERLGDINRLTLRLLRA